MTCRTIATSALRRRRACSALGGDMSANMGANTGANTGAELTCRCPVLGRARTGRCPMRDSNRSFGLLIGGVLLLVAAHHYWKERPDFFVWLIVGLVLVAVALLMPRTLAPLRRLWLKLGHLMSVVVSPIILG